MAAGTGGSLGFMHWLTPEVDAAPWTLRTAERVGTMKARCCSPIVLREYDVSTLAGQKKR
jgi:hypothetical protein